MSIEERANPDCPDCNGTGIVEREVIRTGTRWVEGRHGRPESEPVPIRDVERDFCSCIPHDPEEHNAEE